MNAPSMGVRAILSTGADFGRMFIELETRKLSELNMLLRYAFWVKHRGRKTTMQDIPILVNLWVDVFAGCCTAHSKADYDSADYNHDEILTPILSAPIAQLREFGAALCTALENDPRIPYIVWRPFTEMLEKSLKDLTRERVIVLKERLARDIAEAVEDGVKPQIVDAITNALKWRDEATLTKVKTAVKAGGEPKLIGRQSCLYLEVAGERVML